MKKLKLELNSIDLFDSEEEDQKYWEKKYGKYQKKNKKYYDLNLLVENTND